MPSLDLAVIYPATQVGATELAQFGFGSNAKMVTGIEKLGQQFYICLLTARGSNISDATYGTTLPRQLATANVGTDDAITSAINQALSQACQWFLANQPSTLDAVERLAGAVLLSTVRSAAGDGISALIQVTSKAGTNFTLSGPITP